MEINKMLKFYKENVSNFAIIGKTNLVVFLALFILIFSVLVLIFMKFNLIVSLSIYLIYVVISHIMLNFYCKIIVSRKYKLNIEGLDWKRAIYNLKANRLRSYLIKNNIYTVEKINTLIEAITVEINNKYNYFLPFGKELFTILVTVMTIVTTISLSNLVDKSELENILYILTLSSITVIILIMLIIYFVKSFIDIIFDSSKLNLKTMRVLLFDLKLKR